MSIGDQGFPDALIAHEKLAWGACSMQFMLSAFVLPGVILVCLAVHRWRKFSLYFIAYGILYVAGWGLMLLAPKTFLNWWWD